MALKVVLDNRTVYFHVVRRKKQKRLIFYALEDNVYKVTTPTKMSQKTIEYTIQANLEKILELKPRIDIKKALIEAKKVPVFNELYDREYFSETSVQETLKAIFRKEVEFLVQRFSRLDPSLDLHSVKFRVQYMTSKFGSCQPHKRRITLNLELIHYPKQMLESIFAHEIAHLKHPNHSAAYYRYLSTLMPNHKALKKQLNGWHKTLVFEGFDALINVTNNEISSII